MKIEYDERVTIPDASREIETLLGKFHSHDGAERQRSREALVKIGKAAVPALMELLRHPNGMIRWEACKTLEKIRDYRAAHALAQALLDENMDVRWVAADALIELEHRALIPVLEAIERHYDSVLLREAAHHVLSTLKQAGFVVEQTERVLEALTVSELPSKAAFAAIKALDELRIRSR